MKGKDLKEIREKLDLTQEQFAKRLSRHAVTICKYETEVEEIPTVVALAAKQLLTQMAAS